MLLSTQNILKRKLGENPEQTNKRQNNGTSHKSKSDQIITPPNNNTHNPSKLYQNGLFNNPAENQKDFVIVKFSDGCNAKVSHASITIRSIVKDDDLFGEIKKGQSCKVMFHDKILAAVVMCKGSKETLTEHMDTFCETFDTENQNGSSETENVVPRSETLKKLLEEIKEKESELKVLRTKYENLKNLDKEPVSTNDTLNGTTEVNKTVEANSKKTISSILKESEAKIPIAASKKKVAMDSDYPLIPISVKEEILKYGKDRTKKESFLFRYLFVNSFKDQETFFLDNSFQNMTLEYRQFIDMALKLVKSVRPNVKQTICNQMVSQLHCEAKRKFKQQNIRKSLADKRDDSDLSIDKDISNKIVNGTSTSSSLTDEEKLDILEANTLEKRDNLIDYILIDD